MAVFILTAVGAAVTGRFGQALMLAMVGLFGFAAALYARRRNSGDVTRVNAIEYRDERDRQIARDGFAVVGAVALGLSVVGFLVLGVLNGGQAWAPAVQGLVAAQLLVQALVWAVANYAAARRH